MLSCGGLRFVRRWSAERSAVVSRFQTYRFRAVDAISPDLSLQYHQRSPMSTLLSHGGCQKTTESTNFSLCLSELAVCSSSRFWPALQKVNVSYLCSHRLDALLSLIIQHWKTKAATTTMWANAQPDGRPAEHRRRPLFNAAKFG